MVLAWAKLWEFTIEQKVQKKTMFLLIRFQSQRIVQYWNISYSKWGMQVQILQWLLQPFPWKILSGDDINVAKIHYLFIYLYYKALFCFPSLLFHPAVLYLLMFEFSIVIVNHVKGLGPFIDLWGNVSPLAWYQSTGFDV